MRTFFNFIVTNNPAPIRPKKTAEQAEDSSPSHGYFPAGKFRYPASRRRAPVLRSSKYSLLTLLLRLRHPNSKKISRVFCEILFLQKLYTFRFLNTKRSKSCESVPHFLTPKNSFRKTESALVPPPAQKLLGQNTKEKFCFPFRRKNRGRANQKMRTKLFFGVASVSERRRGGLVVPLKMGSCKVYDYSTSVKKK